MASRGGSLDLSDGGGRTVLMLDDMLRWGREMIKRCVVCEFAHERCLEYGWVSDQTKRLDLDTCTLAYH